MGSRSLYSRALGRTYQRFSIIGRAERVASDEWGVGGREEGRGRSVKMPSKLEP